MMPTLLRAGWRASVLSLLCGLAVGMGESQTFHWASRPTLDDAQGELVRAIRTAGESEPGTPRRAEADAEIAALREELGARVVRPVRGNELIVRHVDAEIAEITNTAADTVVFSVAVEGDEEWMGSRKGSIARQTYLPAGGKLLVPHLYWMTVRTQQVYEWAARPRLSEIHIQLAAGLRVMKTAEAGTEPWEMARKEVEAAWLRVGGKSVRLAAAEDLMVLPASGRRADVGRRDVQNLSEDTVMFRVTGREGGDVKEFETLLPGRARLVVEGFVGVSTEVGAGATTRRN